ncbi:MAG: hypothetical protein ABIA77_02395 [Candidatus Omnitrophota bacterium]
MLKNAFMSVICLSVALCASTAFAEINVSAVDGKIEVMSADGKVILDEGNPTATVTDTNGAKVNVTYDAETKGVTVNAESGSSSVTVGIAKVYMEQGQQLGLTVDEGTRNLTITNTATGGGPIVVVFPDGSKVSIPAGAGISLTMLADGNYDMKVTSGTVEYTDPEGNKRSLTGDSPVIIVQGFTTVPGWRTSEEETMSPATP